jgi:hypothetical protein
VEILGIAVSPPPVLEEGPGMVLGRSNLRLG